MSVTTYPTNSFLQNIYFKCSWTDQVTQHSPKSPLRFDINIGRQCQGIKWNEIHLPTSKTLASNSLSYLASFLARPISMTIRKTILTSLTYPSSWCGVEIAAKCPWQHYEDNMKTSVVVTLWVQLKTCETSTWFYFHYGT